MPTRRASVSRVRHAVAAHVEHVPADGEVGPVTDAEPRQRRRVLGDELVEGRVGVTQATVVAVGDRHAMGPDVEREALGWQRRVELRAHVRRSRARPRTRLDDLARTREQHLVRLVLN